MKRSTKNSAEQGGNYLENIVFAIFVFVIALRATFAEAPGVPLQGVNQLLGNDGFSLLITSLLLGACTLWFLGALFARQFRYSKSYIEIGLAVFFVVSVVGVFFASNKRAAITESVTLLAPMLMAVVLIQLLKSRRGIGLLLTVIVAMGIVNAHQCVDQFFSSNEVMIEHYEENPEEFLAKLNIVPGSFKQMSLEHRLYSKDVRGFMTTSNSASSFMMLASFAGLALFLTYLKSTSKDKGIWLILSGGVVVLCFACFGLTLSKGAIGALLVSFVIFAGLMLFAGWIRKNLTVVVIVVLLAAIFASAGLAFYGQKNGRLPGGNSMLVRWQYWVSSLEIFKSDPVLGVGAGNFATAYMTHKTPAAPETIRDPHNFILSLLCQYGPVGLLAVLAAMLMPMFQSLRSDGLSVMPIKSKSGPNFLLLLVGGTVCVGLFVCRPFLIPLAGATSALELLLASWYIYAIPVIVFAIVLLLIFRVELGLGDDTICFTDGSAWTIFAGICGVLIHNLIDFAIFEPAVWTALWASIACLFAIRNCQPEREFVLGKMKRGVLLSVTLALSVLFIAIVLRPVLVSNVLFQQVMRDGRLAVENHTKASAVDSLDPEANLAVGNLYLSQFQFAPKRDVRLLEMAEENFAEVSRRDVDAHASYQRLSVVYEEMADRSFAATKEELLEKSYAFILEAIERYPGSDKLHFQAAGLAEKLGKTDAAISGYSTAVEIENAYRAQFEVMYPGREMFSRLGQDKYEIAKERIAELE